MSYCKKKKKKEKEKPKSEVVFAKSQINLFTRPRRVRDRKSRLKVPRPPRRIMGNILSAQSTALRLEEEQQQQAGPAGWFRLVQTGSDGSVTVWSSRNRTHVLTTHSAPVCRVLGPGPANESRASNDIKQQFRAM